MMSLFKELALLFRPSLNSATAATINSLRTAASLFAQNTGGVDETLNAVYEAFQFIAHGTEMGGVSLNLRRDSGTTAGTITMFLYSETSAHPGANISDTTTGLPSIIYVADLATTYGAVQFRLPKTGLTDRAKYWVVLQMSGVTGGNVYLERRSNGTGLYANSADASAWNIENTKEARYTILGHAGLAISGNADTGDGIYGQSTSGFGGRFLSNIGPGLKADSRYNFGVGGTSFYGIGVRGSSNLNHAIQGVSTGLAGGQFITSGAGQPGIQAVSTSGPAMQLAPGTGAFSQFFPTDASAGGIASTWGYIAEEVTLNGTTTTDSTTNLLPANAIIDAVSWRWTAAMTGGTATAFQIGTAADAIEFQNTSVTFALGNSGVGLNQWLTGGHAQAVAADTKIRITLNGTSSTGKIRLVVCYRAYTAPSS